MTLRILVERPIRQGDAIKKLSLKKGGTRGHITPAFFLPPFLTAKTLSFRRVTVMKVFSNQDIPSFRRAFDICRRVLGILLLRGLAFLTSGGVEGTGTVSPRSF